MNSRTEKRKLGVALVGLGKYSEGELGPALKETSQCRLTAVVSGNPEKRNKWKSEYGLKDTSLYGYENFDRIASNPEVDIVYIVLPNSMHAEFAIRAARAGKHVICEKPMATSKEDCERMINACREAGVKLSVGYRLHFDPYNQEMMRLGQEKILGPVKEVTARNGMDVGDKNQWRLNKELAGGGPLMDLGIYCVQGAIYTVGELPVSVVAGFKNKTKPEKFDQVEEGIEWEMEFPGGCKAKCETSYTEEYDQLKAGAEHGWFELQPAYEYRGLKGNSTNGEIEFPAINQQAAQMDAFASCILSNEESRVPGEMGLRDVQILEAIYESAKTGKKIELHLNAYEHLIEH
jgi:predicted dehydrogenase